MTSSALQITDYIAWSYDNLVLSESALDLLYLHMYEAGKLENKFGNLTQFCMIAGLLIGAVTVWTTQKSIGFGQFHEKTAVLVSVRFYAQPFLI